MSSFSYPAAKPPRWHITSSRPYAVLDCTYRLNGEGPASDYTLYANKMFRGVTETNDPTGVIRQLVMLASQRDSSVSSINVGSHQLSVTVSLACPAGEAENMLRQAVLRAGLGPITIG